MKVIGIGNALVDILIRLNNDDILQSLGLEKGSMTLVDLKLSSAILAVTQDLPGMKASGGSAANTIHGLSHLGLQTAFIGKIGADEFGDFFRNDMEANRIFSTLYNSETETGRAIALVSPDSERTFATFLGASVNLTAEDILEDIFIDYDMCYVEGYLVQNPKLIEKSLKLAKSFGLQTCLDLASYNVVSANREFLLALISKYVDIVFANEDEVKALLGKSPEAAIHELAEICSIALVKLGANGSLVKKGNEVVMIEPRKSFAIDTTGAGDLYASGFIYGLSENLDLKKCGELGSLLSGKVIEVIGAKMEPSTWNLIKKEIERFT